MRVQRTTLVYKVVLLNLFLKIRTISLYKTVKAVRPLFHKHITLITTSIIIVKDLLSLQLQKCIYNK